MDESSPTPATPATVVRPVPLKWRHRAAAAAIYGCGKTLMATWQQEFTDRTGILQQSDGPPVIFAVWHNRLASCMVAWHGYVRRQRPTSRLAALISASKDGGLLANALDRFGVHPIRGSSSRRGRQALLECATSIERGYCIAVTPDGPRGPKYSMQPGVIALAQVTGAPIIPVTVQIRRRISLGSWDAFQIPLPFAAMHITFCEPIHVGRDSGETDRAEIASRLATVLGRD